MNFFQQLATMNLVGDLKLIVKSTGEQMTVSVLLDNSQCGDAAKNVIPPLVLNGTAQELDEGFFATIDQPIKKTSGLQVQMEAYMAQVATAEKQSKMAKDAKEKAEKAQADKKKVFDETIKKVDELVKEKKYKEAIAKLPKPAEYPDHASAIDKKKKYILGLAGGGDQASLFESPGALAAGQDIDASEESEEREDDDDRDDADVDEEQEELETENQ